MLFNFCRAVARVSTADPGPHITDAVKSTAPQIGAIDEECNARIEEIYFYKQAI